MMMMMMMCWCCWHEKNKSIVEACDSHRLESLQGLQHSTALVKADVPVSPRPQHPSRTSPWAVFGGFPMLLIMCAAGDGSHAMLILLSSSGKYPASLRRTKTTKNWVWLQPPGFCAPTRTCPRVTACCFLLTIYPCPTLLPHTIFLWPSIKPMKDSYVFLLTYSIPLFHPRDYNSTYIHGFRRYKGIKLKRRLGARDESYWAWWSLIFPPPFGWYLWSNTTQSSFSAPFRRCHIGSSASNCSIRFNTFSTEHSHKQ